MRFRRAAWLLLCVACGTTDAPAGLSSGPAGRIRVVNLTGQTANAILEGLPLGVNLGVGAVAPASLPAPSTALYAPILAGDRRLVLRATGDTSLVIGIYDLTIVANQDRSVYAFGGLNAQFETVDTNTTSLLASASARMRVVNTSVVGNVDLFITTATAALATSTASVTNVGTRAKSAYFTTVAGTHRFRFVRSGVTPANRDANVVSNVNNVVVAGGTARTVLLVDAGAAAATILLADQ